MAVIERPHMCHMAHPDLDLARTLAGNARGFLGYPSPGTIDRPLQDRFYRLAIALELALKCYLVIHGHTDESNRAIGHDLRRATTAAEAEGLILASPLCALIDDTHPFFMQGGFHRERRTDWNHERADRATSTLASLLDQFDALSGAA
ncbi:MULTISPECIES: hypothetical protein [Sphingomonadales]|jgi:hypothetical protein|uniref:HEPN domain-containing protein n=2 Tax=Sphingomonadaceae TaxID=41297 RepID=A0ABV7N9Z3_9SPHN|nr:hypothetical protein [Novosphingobium profundi]MBT0671598.1 hypothetical protein [Novosphingobium profundi]MEC7934067.1 hypothetical protein [Pseudomonadota bacterium]|tara:strand:+ start:72 stop:515 length:444 start_codon:yes stop_codon:yes gene_type:complete